jgi:hypothetical protein
MKLLNRGFIAVKPSKHFIEWANTFESEWEIDLDVDSEPTVYLISEDFLEIEPVLKLHFRQIFMNELSMITENEEDWPESLSMERFLEWFNVEVGSTLFDLEKSDLRSEKL